MAQTILSDQTISMEISTFQEYQDCSAVLNSWVSTLNASPDPDILKKQLQRHWPLLEKLCPIVGNCGDRYEEAFTYPWSTQLYPLNKKTRDAIRRGDAASEGQPNDILLRSASLLISSDAVINYYGSLLMAFLGSEIMHDSRLWESDRIAIFNNIRSLVTDTIELPEPVSPTVGLETVMQLMCRACIFIGDALRHVTSCVSKDKLETNDYSKWDVQKVRERFQESKAEMVYEFACRLYPRSGNPHNQLAALRLSMGDKWPALLAFIRAMDAIEKPFAQAKGNIGVVGSRLREHYGRERERDTQRIGWNEAANTGIAGAIKLQDWSSFMHSWETVLSRFFDAEGNRVDTSHSLGESTLLRVGCLSCMLLQKKHREDAPTLEMEIVSLLRSAGLPGQQGAPALTLQELSHCVYALQYALFENTYVVRGGETPANAGISSKEVLLICLDGSLQEVSLRWSDTFAHSLHATYMISAFALEFILSLCRMNYPLDELDLLRCHEMVTSIVNMATVLRVHLSHAMQAPNVLDAVDNYYVHEDCSQSTDYCNIHYSHVGLGELVRRLDGLLFDLLSLDTREGGSSTIQNLLACRRVSDGYECSKMLTTLQKHTSVILFPSGQEGVVPTAADRLGAYKAHCDDLARLVEALLESNGVVFFDLNDPGSLWTFTGQGTATIRTQDDCPFGARDGGHRARLAGRSQAARSKTTKNAVLNLSVKEYGAVRIARSVVHLPGVWVDLRGRGVTALQENIYSVSSEDSADDTSMNTSPTVSSPSSPWTPGSGRN